MSTYLNECDKNFLELAKTAGRISDQLGFKAYIVGGVVRDIMLKKRNLDLDIAIEGDSLAVAKKLSSTLRAKLKIYSQFQTATVILKNGVHVDLAMCRNEKYAAAAVLPEVSSGTIKEDLFRRDFTVNAMAIAIHAEGFGELVDFYNGVEDLNNKCLRVLHPRSFIDDPTRILRAVRFEQRLGFEMDPKTLRCLKDSIRKNLDLKVKPPRYFAEFKKFFLEDDPFKYVSRIKELRGVRTIDARGNIDLPMLKAVSQRVQILSKNKDYADPQRWWPVYFFALLEKKNAHQLEKISQELQLESSLSLSLLQARECPGILKQLSNKNKKASEIFKLLKPFTDLTLLYFYVRSEDEMVVKRIDDFVSVYSQVELDVDGDDLKKMGYPSGEVIGQALESLLLKKIDKQLPAKKNELKEAEMLLKRKYSRKTESADGKN